MDDKTKKSNKNNDGKQEERKESLFFRFFGFFGFEGTSKIFEKTGLYIGKGFYILMTILGTIFFAASGFFIKNFDLVAEWEKAESFGQHVGIIFTFPASLLTTGGLFILVGGLGTFVDQSKQNRKIDHAKAQEGKIKNLRLELNASQEEMQNYKSTANLIHKELVSTWLKGVFKIFNFDSSERITIYYEDGKVFHLLARHSKNPMFCEIHRQKFPINQGVISHAWQNEICIESRCPSSENEEEYYKYMYEKYGYSRDKTCNLTMQSCRFYAKAITDADVHVGVIVFESKKVDAFSKEVCDAIESYCNEHQSQLAKFVRESKDFDREIVLKRKTSNNSVEDDILKTMEGAQ